MRKLAEHGFLVRFLVVVVQLKGGYAEVEDAAAPGDLAAREIVSDAVLSTANAANDWKLMTPASDDSLTGFSTIVLHPRPKGEPGSTPGGAR